MAFKKMYTIAVFIFHCIHFCSGQETKTLWEDTPKPRIKLSMDVQVANMPMISNNFHVFDYEVKFSKCSKFETGYAACWSSKKIDNSFSYAIQQPKITYFQIGWINQYNFLITNRFRLSANINNAFADAELGDNSIIVKVATPHGYANRAKEIAKNRFYLVEPGISFSVRLYTIQPNKKAHDQGCSIYLTTTAKYRFLFGSAQYGTHKQFSNYYLGAGLSFTPIYEVKAKNN